MKEYKIKLIVFKVLIYNSNDHRLNSIVHWTQRVHHLLNSIARSFKTKDSYTKTHWIHLHKGLIENCGSILSMFFWLDSTHPIKIPNLPKENQKRIASQNKIKTQINVHKKPPIDQPNHKP